MNAPIYTMRGVEAYKNRRNLAMEAAFDRHDQARAEFGLALANARPVFDRTEKLTDKFDEPALPLWLALLLTAAVGFFIGRFL